MTRFELNGHTWDVIFVEPHDHRLVDRTGEIRVATTDPKTRCIYLSQDLHGTFLRKVLIHELSHCAMVSYDLLGDIHRMTKQRYWVEAEEWVCNFLADYSFDLLSIANDILLEVL